MGKMICLKDSKFQKYCDCDKGQCIKIVTSKKKNFLLCPANETNTSTPMINNIKISLSIVGSKDMDALKSDAPGKKSSIFSSLGETTVSTYKSENQSDGKAVIECLDVEKWTTDDVQEWLQYVRGESGVTLDEKCSTIFMDNDVDGKTLVSLSDELLESMEVNCSKTRQAIMKHINRLKTTKKFDMREYIVMSKFERINPNYLADSEDIEKIASRLYDISEIKKSYLSYSDVQGFDKETIEKISKQERTDDASSFEITEKPLQYSQQCQRNHGHSPNLQCKLLISEICHTNRYKSLQRITSPIISSIPCFQKGHYFAAIIIGPWYLEWSDTSLCIPKQMVKSTALLALDAPVIATIPKKEGSLEELSHQIAEVVVEWNVKYQYGKKEENTSFKQEPRQYMGDSLDFIKAILIKLSIPLSFWGNHIIWDEIQEIISRNGKSADNFSLDFKPTKEFINKLNLSDSRIVFKTHRELDGFVINMKKGNCTFTLDFPYEQMILQFLDRIFWIRHLKDQSEENYKPISKFDNAQEVLSCCFRSTPT